ncbi:hypothetical protein Ancab_009241 [Ancistrocladus abbreviatus]
MDKTNEIKWTNEKHLNFLSLMETTFVKAMLESSNFRSHRRLPPLDRYVPDISESTLDSRALKRTNNHFADGVDLSNRKTRVSRQRRASLAPVNASQDQVVPQVHDTIGDKGEKD